MNYYFDKSIGPFEGKDFEDAIYRLSNYRDLIDSFIEIISRRSMLVNALIGVKAKNQLEDLLKSVHSYDDFQKKITCDLFLKIIEQSSIDRFTYEGINELDSKPHIFISNHRDIVLDTALLDLALYREGRTLCEMVVGDNMFVNQFATDMFKCNGSITVKRTASSASELKDITVNLSRYIANCIDCKKENVWIAQKSGRSKDGKDNTSGAILKMLYLASKEQGLGFDEFLNRYSIVPVSISYQYDPCDVTKSQEEIRKLKAQGCYDVYKKKKYEDILDLVRGLRLYKGNVHIKVGKSLSGENCKTPKDAVRELDRQIHLNYRLWNTNYYAWDKMNGKTGYKDFYSDLNIKALERKYSGFKNEVVDMVFASYANPVQSMLDEQNDSNIV